MKLDNHCFYQNEYLSKGSVNLCKSHNSVALIMSLGLENPFPIARSVTGAC